MSKKSNNGIIIVYTTGSFPYGAASANRLLNLSLSFQHLGYKVIVLAKGNGVDQVKTNKITHKNIYKGIEYRDFSNLVTNIYDIKEIIANTITLEENKKIKMICFSHKNISIKNINYVKKIGASSCVDVTEWHNYSQFIGLKQKIKYLKHIYKIMYVIPKSKNIICISSFLSEYYTEKKCNTIIIPPQIDALNENQISEVYYDKAHINEEIKFLYAGSMGKKDFLDVALEGFSLLDKEILKKIKITILGADLTQFIEHIPKAEKYMELLGNSLLIKGRVPKSEVEKELLGTHFLFFMRPLQRYSKAGFPSKVPEALNLGVPIITNFTSDLNIYLKDGYNSVILNSLDSREFKSKIESAVLNIDNFKYENMSNAAKETAMTAFDYRVSEDELMTYLENIE